MKKDTRILRGEQNRRGGKNEIPPTPSPAFERGKQAVRGKIADVLRQCYMRL